MCFYYIRQLKLNADKGYSDPTAIFIRYLKPKRASEQTYTTYGLASACAQQCQPGSGCHDMTARMREVLRKPCVGWCTVSNVLL